MLNRGYFLRQRFDGAAFPAAGVVVADVIDPGDGGNWRDLLERCYGREGNYPFCLALKALPFVTKEALDRLLLFLVHPFYERWGREKPLFLLGKGEGIEDYFYRQGLHVVLLPVDRIKRLPVRNGDAGADYYRYCLNGYDPEDVFLMEGEGALEGVRWCMKRLEAGHPGWVRLAKDYLRLRKERDALAAEREMLNEQNGSLQELLRLSSQHDEVNYILRWYRNEYEILPLWWKRAGQALKVLLGKRSFRSLYDKTAKKYKD